MTRLVDVIGTLGEVAENEAWIDYLQYSHSSKDVTPLLAVIVDYQNYMAAEDGGSSWKPVHAWRALGQIGLARAIEPLIGQFNLLHEDDWAFIELPQVVAMLGADSLPPLAAYLLQPGHDEFARAMALEALVLLQQQQPELQQAVKNSLLAYLQNPDTLHTAFNGLLVGEALDLEFTDLRPAIENLYQNNWVDTDVCGKLDYVQNTFASIKSSRQEEAAALLASEQKACKQTENVKSGDNIDEDTDKHSEDNAEQLTKPRDPDDVIGLLDYYLDHYATEDSILSCSELDGFCHAMLSGPNVLDPAIWMPLIWGDKQQEPEWELQYEAKDFPDLVFSVYSHALENLAKGEAEPLFYEPDNDGKSYDVANEWCAGYLRGGVFWEEIDEAEAAIIQPPIDAIKLFATEEGFLELDAMDPPHVATALQKALDGVNQVYQYFYALRSKPLVREASKVGRNDPCPCGSGKKHKKCCMNKN